MMRAKSSTMRQAIAMAATAASLALGGCAAMTPANPVTPKTLGKVYAGLQPVSGATVQLYAVGNTGSKSAATPLLSQTVLTAADGGFDIANLWNCSNTAAYGSDPLLYVVATGGSPGLGSGVSNSALAMMTALGRCSTVTASNLIYVNEVTTVASTYALAPFLADYAHVGTTAANMGALATAFSSVTSLVNTTTGVSPGAGAVAGATVPVSEINTLANVLDTCVHSTGGAACTALLAATTPNGGTTPTETIGAVLQIARAPLHSVADLYSLNSSTASFQPSLTIAPNDWSLMVKYTGGGLSGPAGIAVDANGNAWIANGGGGNVTEIGNQGAFLTGTTGYSGNGTILGAQAVAVDRGGNVWLAVTLLSSVVKLSLSSGIIQSSASFTHAINGPTSLAVDSQNDVWVANFGDGSVTELSSTGTPMGASPLQASGTLKNPDGVAIDGIGNVWVSDNAASVVAKFAPNQNLLSGTGFSDTALFAPEGVAVDSQGRAWVAGNGSGGASLFQADGTSPATSPYHGGGLSQPTSVAIDGAGAAWITNGIINGSVTQIPSIASSPLGGIGSLNIPTSVAIDASGNVWTANSGDDSVSKFIGLATPITTPMATTAGP